MSCGGDTGWTRRGFVAAAGAAVAGLVAGPGLAARLPRSRASTRGAALPNRPVSRPDLAIPPVGVDVPADGTAPGYLFVAPFSLEQMPPAGAQFGPLILDDSGEPVWFLPVSGKTALDFRVQRYRGKPVITWYEGEVLGAYGGDFVIVDPTYHRVARVQAGHDLRGDLHEFLITSRNTALISIYSEVQADLTPIGGARSGRLVEGVVQELELPTGRVLFEWHSLDHVPITDSYRTELTPPGNVDYFHLNSIGVDLDGDLLVSARNTSAIYKVDRRSGEVRWRLGGKSSDFALGPGAAFYYQHDARRQRDGTLTLFDNGAWMAGKAGAIEASSRPVRLALDETEMKATLVESFRPAEPRLAFAMGNMQRLPDDGFVVGWGTAGSFTEFAPDGRVRFDAHFADGSVTYRAFRFPWAGRPTGAPTVEMTSNADGLLTVHASWNGATRVAHWQVRTGTAVRKLRAVRTVARTGFETAIVVRSPKGLVSVAALDSNGKQLGASIPRAAPH